MLIQGSAFTQPLTLIVVAIITCAILVGVCVAIMENGNSNAISHTIPWFIGCSLCVGSLALVGLDSVVAGMVAGTAASIFINAFIVDAR